MSSNMLEVLDFEIKSLHNTLVIKEMHAMGMLSDDLYKKYLDITFAYTGSPADKEFIAKEGTVNE